MTEDAKAQRQAEAEEKAKQRQLQREAMERERESKTQILRKRVPGQVEQPKPVFTLPPPDTVCLFYSFFIDLIVTWVLLLFFFY
jgi:hypothetical protein